MSHLIESDKEPEGRQKILTRSMETDKGWSLTNTLEIYKDYGVNDQETGKNCLYGSPASVRYVGMPSFKTYL